MPETWVGNILWRGEKLSTPVFRPGEYHGLYIHEAEESDTAEQLSLTHPLINYVANLAELNADRYFPTNNVTSNICTNSDVYDSFC